MKVISHEKLYRYNSINIYLVALSYPFVHLYAIKTESIAMFYFSFHVALWFPQTFRLSLFILIQLFMEIIVSS